MDYGWENYLHLIVHDNKMKVLLQQLRVQYNRSVIPEILAFNHVYHVE